MLFMIGAGFCQSSHAVLYSFGTLTWRSAGLDDVTISLLWGESVAVEILMMMGSGWLMKRVGVTGLIGLGLAAGLIRWTGMAFTTALPALILLQALHAFTFAACHAGSRPIASVTASSRDWMPKRRLFGRERSGTGKARNLRPGRRACDAGPSTRLAAPRTAAQTWRSSRSRRLSRAA